MKVCEVCGTIILGAPERTESERGAFAQADKMLDELGLRLLERGDKEGWAICDSIGHILRDDGGADEWTPEMIEAMEERSKPASPDALTLARQQLVRECEVIFDGVRAKCLDWKDFRTFLPMRMADIAEAQHQAGEQAGLERAAQWIMDSSGLVNCHNWPTEAHAVTCKTALARCIRALLPDPKVKA